MTCRLKRVSFPGTDFLSEFNWLCCTASSLACVQLYAQLRQPFSLSLPLLSPLFFNTRLNTRPFFLFPHMHTHKPKGSSLTVLFFSCSFLFSHSLLTDSHMNTRALTHLFTHTHTANVHALTLYSTPHAHGARTHSHLGNVSHSFFLPILINLLLGLIFLQLGSPSPITLHPRSIHSHLLHVFPFQNFFDARNE